MIDPRTGRTLDGRSTDRLAGLVDVHSRGRQRRHAICVHAYYYGDKAMTIDNLLHFLVGTALKDKPEDRRRFRHYFETEVPRKHGAHWQEAFAQRTVIPTV